MSPRDAAAAPARRDTGRWSVAEWPPAALGSRVVGCSSRPRLRRAAVGLGALVVATGCAPTRSGGGEAAPPPALGSGVLRPAQIQAILQRSERVYRVRMSVRVPPRPLDELVMGPVGGAAPRLDPFLEVTRSGERPVLRSHLPEDEIEPLFEAASRAFADRDYLRARALYEEAVRQAPEYFKAYTYLGNALFFLGRYVEAEVAFRKALDLNPQDYQAHLFLGDTLHQLGHFQESKEALTWAFMLNRGNAVVEERLRTTLAKLQLSLRGSRLAPAVRLERSTDETVIHLDADEGRKWYALAACVACWKEEDTCRERSPDARDPLRLGMYRECLLNHVADLTHREARGEELAQHDRVLRAAVEDGFLDAIVFWEAVAPRAPAVMLLLSDELRADVVRYIERYVFVSTRLADAGAPPRREVAVVDNLRPADRICPP